MSSSPRSCPLFSWCPQFAYGVPDLQLKDIACSQSLLERFLLFPSRRGLYAVRHAMCALSPMRLQMIEDRFYANIDFFKLFRVVSVLPLSRWHILCLRFYGSGISAS